MARALPIAGLLLALAIAPAWAADPALPPLATRLDSALSVPGLSGAELSVLVVDRVTGQELFSRNADRLLLPASTQKILTSVAALSVFGPSHRFETEIAAKEPPNRFGAVGDLYVRGGGDPAMTSEQWWRLAADLRAEGLRRVRGALVVDDSLFDGVRWHPSWLPVTARAYYAPVGALSANYGDFRVVVRPGRKAGLSASVWVDPPVSFFHLVGRVSTGPAGSEPKVQVDRTGANGRETVHVSGSVPAGGEPVEVWRSVAEPALYAAAVLRMQLRANGISVVGGVRRGPTPQDPGYRHVFEGFPLTRITSLFLKNSNNFMAEVLVKAMGAHAAGPGVAGTWQNGIPALRSALGALDIPLAGARLVDGSGLSREDRVSARILVAALRRADLDFALAPEFEAALPIAGEDGTLHERVLDAAALLRAKTGSLDGVTALAGFAHPPQGHDRIFAILVNRPKQGDQAAAEAVDGFAEALVAGGSAPVPGSRPATSPR